MTSDEAIEEFKKAILNTSNCEQIVMNPAERLDFVLNGFELPKPVPTVVVHLDQISRNGGER